MRFILRIFERDGQRKDAATKAAQIKAKYEAKRKEQGLFTPAQEALMDELGLTPGAAKEISNEDNSKKKARDPLTARQRKLAEELGLIKPE